MVYVYIQTVEWDAKQDYNEHRSWTADQYYSWLIIYLEVFLLMEWFVKSKTLLYGEMKGTVNSNH